MESKGLYLVGKGMAKRTGRETQEGIFGCRE